MYGVIFLWLNTKRQVTVETSGPDYTNYIGGLRGHVPRQKIFENCTLWNVISCIPWIERN